METNSNNNLIITFDGTIAKKDDCRYIKGDFYERNRQCFFIGGRWYRINSGYIVYDHEKLTYALKNSSLVRGIVGTNDDEWEIGFFTENPSKNISVMIGHSEIIALSEDVVKKKNLVEVQLNSTDIFTDEKTKSLLTINPSLIKCYKQLDSLPYSSKDLLEETTEAYNKFYFNHKKPDEYSPFIQDSSVIGLIGTFGIEFESQKGRIPNRYLYRLGLIPLRDGSIEGDEYATIPFRGKIRDLRALEDIVDIMRKYISIDAENSLHVHTKIQDFSKEFFITDSKDKKLL